MRRSWRGRVRRGAGGLAAAIVLAGTTVQTPGAAACIDPQPPSVAADTLKALSRGVNLAGWMDRPATTAPDITVLRTLRQAGMSHVRLPVPAETVMRRFSSQEDLKAQLRAVDAALSELISLGFHVSVDLHPGDAFAALHRDNPQQAMIAMRDAWDHLAAVIGRHPVRETFAELLNEPDIEPLRWQSEVEQLARYVRSLLPQTTLIVGSTNWQRADALPDFRPLSDPNVVYAIHFYDPMAFTHQGHWDQHEPLSSIRGLPFPIEPDGAAVTNIRRQLSSGGNQAALHELDVAIDQAKGGDLVDNQLEPAVTWQQRFLRPLIIDEFGVLKAQAPPESRARWLGAVVAFAERHCWGWTHWELSQGFGLLDDRTGRPDPAIMRALLRRP